jgi:hypothetical protein
MSARFRTIFDDLFPDESPEFRAIAEVWPAHVITQILTLVWRGFDRLKMLDRFREINFTTDYAQLERSLTDLHMDEITLLWREQASSFESFIPKHEPWEWQNITRRSARPPSCDLGFVLLSNRRIRWSVEAKVLESPGAVAAYLGDLQKYLTGQSAPFSKESAIGAYLISGEPDRLFETLSRKLKCALTRPPEFASRPHRCSEHARHAHGLAGETPLVFVCHHLVFSLN